MYRVDVLMSCMYQDGFGLADTTRITTGTIIINQSNVVKVVSRIRYGTSQTMIFSRDRGISRSRNLALNKSKADIYLMCDDDEVLVSDYKEILVNAFQDNEDYSIYALMWTFLQKHIGKRKRYRIY